jgi:hypothetical protein
LQPRSNIVLASPIAILLAGVLAAPPPATATGVPPGRSSRAIDDVAIPAVQLIASEAIVGIGVLAANQVHANDAASLAIVAAVPVAYTLATCGIGRLSVAHRGSCWHAATGTVVGFASGLLLYALFDAAPGTNPFPRNPDDTQEFVNGMGAAILTFVVLAPVGSVVGWNAGKTRLDEPPAVPMATPSQAAWSTGRPPRLMFPLFATTF